MFRISRYMHEIANPKPLGPKRNPKGPVVIWNLTRQCNLLCQHCYTNSADKEYKGELSTEEAFAAMDDMRAYGVPVIILSGGEPLIRKDIFELAHRAKDLGFYVALSTNGTMIDESNIDKIKQANFDYVGISLDGIGEVHDNFRRKKGAFEGAMKGMRLCRETGVKVGARFCLTQRNHESFDQIVDLMESEKIDKLYVSHLNYSGRGKVLKKDDAHFLMTRDAMNRLFDEAWRCLNEGIEREFVTGNNDADGVFLLDWIRRNTPESEEHMTAVLKQWGGNATGVNIANVDNLANVHPDSFFWDYSIGNIRDRKFSEIWSDVSEPFMAGLKAKNRPLKGRCGKCQHVEICNGNTRTRAYHSTGDFWAEDPGCYLNDEEIGLTPNLANIGEVKIGGAHTSHSARD